MLSTDNKEYLENAVIDLRIIYNGFGNKADPFFKTIIDLQVKSLYDYELSNSDESFPSYLVQLLNKYGVRYGRPAGYDLL